MKVGVGQQEKEMDTPAVMGREMLCSLQRHCTALEHHADQLLGSVRERSIANTALSRRQDVSCARQQTDVA
jgi:hypothetical protein